MFKERTWRFIILVFIEKSHVTEEDSDCTTNRGQEEEEEEEEQCVWLRNQNIKTLALCL